MKVPLVPFHTWLPAAYAEAPTGTTMLLTGTMSKMGVYGFLRILLPIFYVQLRLVRTPLLWLAVATIVLSAYAALAQKDLKRIFAYSSINHLGYCMLGIFSVLRFTGDDRCSCNGKGRGTQRRLFADVQPWPDRCDVVLVCGAAGKAQWRVARPGRFWRLAKSRSGVLRTDGHCVVFVAGAAGTEWLRWRVPDLQRHISAGDMGFFGIRYWPASDGDLHPDNICSASSPDHFNEKWSQMPDLTMGERLALLPAIALMFVLGIYPQLVLGVINSTAMQMVQQLRF